MITGANIFSGKTSIASFSGTGGSGGAVSHITGVYRKLVGSKEHLDWLKIDLNSAKIITVQDYKHKKSMWMEVHIYSVKAKSQASSIKAYSKK